MGLIAELTSGLAMKVAHRLKRRWAAAMPSKVLRAALAGLLIGAAGLVVPEVLGVGYGSVSFWRHGGGSAGETGLAFVVSWWRSWWPSPVIGGTFAPSLFIGTALGAAIGHGAHELFPSIHAIRRRGMGSFFAGLCAVRSRRC